MNSHSFAADEKSNRVYFVTCLDIRVSGEWYCPSRSKIMESENLRFVKLVLIHHDVDEILEQKGEGTNQLLQE